MDKRAVCERLKEFRAYKKITKKTMAEFLGKDYSGYLLCEQGKRSLQVEDILFLFHMGCNLNWLVAGEGLMEWDEEIVPLSENELVKSLSKSLDIAKTATDTANVQAKAIENLSGRETKIAKLEGDSNNNVVFH